VNFRTAREAIDWLVDTVRERGLEVVFRRYYGTYRGIVEDVEDEENRGRVRVRVLALGQKTAPKNVWAVPMFQKGQMHPPDKDTKVWVMFENGDPGLPMYTGEFLPKGHDLSELEHAEALYRGLKTPFGHWIRLSDDPDDPHLTISMKDRGYASFDKNGSVLVADKNGSHLYLNAESNELALLDSTYTGVTVKDGKLTLVSQGGTAIELGEALTILTPGDVAIAAGGTAQIKAGSVQLGDGAQMSGVLGETLIEILTPVMSALSTLSVATITAVNAPAGAAAGKLNTILSKVVKLK